MIINFLVLVSTVFLRQLIGNWSPLPLGNFCIFFSILSFCISFYIFLFFSKRSLKYGIAVDVLWFGSEGSSSRGLSTEYYIYMDIVLVGNKSTFIKKNLNSSFSNVCNALSQHFFSKGSSTFFVKCGCAFLSYQHECSLFEGKIFYFDLLVHLFLNFPLKVDKNSKNTGSVSFSS